MAIRKSLGRFARLIFIAVGTAVVVFGILLYRNLNKTVPHTETVLRRTVNEIVLASGHVHAQGLADIYPSTTGIITELYVADGELVSEGQELFAVKSTATEEKKQAAYAAYLAAQTSVNDAESTADTLRSDMYDAWKEYYDLATNDTYEEEDGTPKELERGAVEFQTSKYDWIASEKKYTDQQEKIGAAAQQAQALYQTYQATQDSITTAPSSGVIANIVPSVGDLVTALPSLSATPVLALTNFESYYVEVEIKETDIPKLTTGQKATIVLDALPDLSLHGTVTTVDLLGKNDAGVITYTTRIRLTDENPAIRHMMSATVHIIVSTKHDTVTISPAALQEKDGEKGVLVATGNNTMKWRPVIVGATGGEWVEIVDGVSEGEQVVIPTIE